MANLPEISEFTAGIFQLETSTPALGGVNGPANSQAKALANRTLWLKEQIEAMGGGGQAARYDGDMVALTAPGFYNIGSGATNKPVAGTGMALVIGRDNVPEAAGDNVTVQVFVDAVTGALYIQVIIGGTVTAAWAKQIDEGEFDNFKAGFVGQVATFAQSTAPTGWIKCNGAAVSRTLYPDLFAAIGTTYGAGNGSTTFNVPDMRGEFARGWDDGRGVDTGRAIGTAQSEMVGPHDHPYNDNNDIVIDEGAQSTQTVKTGTLAATSGANSGTENRPRNIALNYCIKY